MSMNMKQLCNDNNTLPDSDEMDHSPISILPTEMLQYIFKIIPLRDLLRCRKVNHKWRSAATLPARKKCVPIPFSRKIKMDQRSKIVSEFNDCVRETAGEFPVSTFHFTWNSVDRWIEYNGSPVPEFFELVSPFISELSVDFRLGAVPMDKMNIKQHEYPKLKRLTLEVHSDHSCGAGRNKKCKSRTFGHDRPLFTFLKDVIKNAPNLDTVEFKIDLDIQNRNTIQKCLTEIGILEKPKLLTSLTILCHFDRVDWQSLIIMGLKLKTFKITFDGDSAVDSTMMKVFLESQTNTLSSLELDYLGDNLGDHGVLIDFPILPQLKHLRISDNYNVLNPETRLRFPSLLYQTQFPALKELNLLKAKLSQVDLFDTRLAPLETVGKLILPNLLCVEMFQVVRSFPNVKKLHINKMRRLHEGHMQVIYDNLPGIEELWLVNMTSCVDFIITGLSMWECENIEEPPSASFNNAVETLQKRRTLACLENLKVLKIHRDHDQKDDEWRFLELKEISAYVLKKMKNLNRLDFGVRRVPPFVSKTLLDDLEKHGIQITSQDPPHKRTVLGLLPRNDFEYYYYSNYTRIR